MHIFIPVLYIYVYTFIYMTENCALHKVSAIITINSSVNCTEVCNYEM